MNKSECIMEPIYECENNFYKDNYYCYVVPHIVPYNNHIINHHIYKHEYIPEVKTYQYDTCENIYECKQNNFFK